MKLKYTNYKIHRNILLFFDQWKLMPDLKISHEKLPDFVWFPLLGFTLVLKLKHLDFESHLNNLCFLDRKKYDVRFEYLPLKKVGFCFISIIWVHYNHETEKICFWNHWIPFHFILFHFISFYFISFHFISFHFISFHFIFWLWTVRGTG